MDETTLKRIQANAALVIDKLSAVAGFDLDYNERSVAWLDGYIERQREHGDAAQHSSLSNVLGSFLGECIVRNFGGEWAMTEHGVGIEFDDANAVFPINKAAKQMAHGADDSVLSFYQTIPLLFGNAGR